MRHAKSSWKDDSIPDEERPLNKRGKSSAAFMGAYLRDHGLAPDGILASSAVRAQETAQRVNKSGKFGLEIQTASELYFSGAEAYVTAISHVDASIRRLLVIGHNPDLETLVHQLTGRDEAMPTAAVACVEVGAMDWEAFSSHPKGRLAQVLRPKELQGEAGDD